MNIAEANDLLGDRLRSYRSLPYDELARRVDTVETSECVGGSGVTYQLEIQFFWDSQPGRDVRVIGSIDDTGWSALHPLSDSFIVSSDGRFVDED